MQKVFWTQGAKVSEKSFAPPKTAFAPVPNGVAPVQEALCSLGPNDLLHPPLSTFGNFPFSVNFPGPQLPNPRFSRKLFDQNPLREISALKMSRFAVCRVRSGSNHTDSQRFKNRTIRIAAPNSVRFAVMALL